MPAVLVCIIISVLRFSVANSLVNVRRQESRMTMLESVGMEFLNNLSAGGIGWAAGIASTLFIIG